MPSGIPLTLQTYAIALCGFVLSGKLGTVSVCIYLLMGALGLPVFAGFRGGMHVFAGPTGGFLFGFLPLVTLCGASNALLVGAGLLCCHLLGALQYSLITGVSFPLSVLNISLPYLVKDAAMVFAAGITARAVRGRLTALQKRPC